MEKWFSGASWLVVAWGILQKQMQFHMEEVTLTQAFEKCFKASQGLAHNKKWPTIQASHRESEEMSNSGLDPKNCRQ